MLSHSPPVLCGSATLAKASVAFAEANYVFLPRPRLKVIPLTTRIAGAVFGLSLVLQAATEPALDGEKYPMTRTDMISRDDISNWSFSQVRYAINEMYARHGYDFPKKEIKNVFLKYQWYRRALKPGHSIENIETEFNNYEIENLKLLGQLRDALKSGRPEGAVTSESTTSAAGPATDTPPEIHAWVAVRYAYRSSGTTERDAHESADNSITATERENLPASELVTRGSEMDRVIDGEATIAPVKCSIHLTRKSNRDSGTLTVTVMDTASGRILEGFPASSKNAIKELKQRDSLGTDATDFVLEVPDSERERLAEDTRKWIIRDEGEDRGKPEISSVMLHIARGPPSP
jgi:hypothetical protein